MRDKHLCDVLEHIYAILRELQRGETETYVEPHFQALIAAIEGMGGSVD